MNSAPPPPWNAREIAIALLLVYGFWPAASFQVLVATGFYDRLYGPQLLELCRSANDAASAPATEDEAARMRAGLLGGQAAARLPEIAAQARAMGRARLHLWSLALAAPFQALTFPAVFWLLGRVPPGRLGLTTNDLGRNVVRGFGGWLLLLPLVLVVNLMVLALFNLTGASGVQEHPLTRLAEDGLSTAEWGLLVFTAIVAAPVLEEIIFRGVLQPWFAGFQTGSHLGMGMALAVALVLRRDPFMEAWRHDGEGLLEAAMPALFVVAVTPLYVAVCRRPRFAGPPAVFATALLFAMVHSFAWPTPVALFVLALGLGRLALRTGSLVGPMVLHGLFNGFSCVVLLLK